MKLNINKDIIKRCEIRIKNTSFIINITPEYIGPIFGAVQYINDSPYITTKKVSILFNKRQESGRLMNLSDWAPISKAIKNNKAVIHLITNDNNFDNIIVRPKELLYNPHVEMFELRGKIVLEQDGVKGE